ncbi:atromentin synthetase [Suillus lakei]|nr:atromentin synthetase [Suillus lakei]
MAAIAIASTTTTEFVTNLKTSVASPQPNTLHDVIAQAVDRYPSHEFGFITSSAHDSSIQTKTFSAFNQYVRNLARAMLEWGKPTGSVVVVYLTEHEDNMAAVWACLLAGYVPCLQPALSAQQAHKEGHVAHIKNLFGSATWLTSELGAEQITSISGLEVHLLSELKASAEKLTVAADWVAYEAKPDDEAILFLTSGSTGFSKAVVHTHRTILAACRAKGQSYGLTSESQVLNWVGFDHVAGSLEMHLTPLLYGASQLHVHASAILADPLRLLRLIDEKSIELAFAPNFLLSKLTRDLEKRIDLCGSFDLSSIKRFNSGGEANPSAVSFVISPGFGMTETCAGCIYEPVDVLATEPAHEFLDLGRPINGCEMRIVDPADGTTLRLDGESGELQVRGPMVFVRYYNNAEATSSSFVEGGWYRTGDVGIIEDGVMRLSGRIKDTVIVHGVSYGIPELETHLQTVEGVTHSFLGAAPYRAPGQETEGFIIFYSPTFDLDGPDASTKLFATHRALRDICVKMITLPPQVIVPIPVNQMEKTTLGKLSRARLISLFKQGQLAKHIARSEELLSEARGASFVSPSTETEKALAKIYAGIFNLAESEMSASDNFFELGGTSIDVIRLKREGEALFGLPEIPTIQILKHPVVSSLANYVNALLSKDSMTEEPLSSSFIPVLERFSFSSISPNISRMNVRSTHSALVALSPVTPSSPPWTRWFPAMLQQSRGPRRSDHTQSRATVMAVLLRLRSLSGSRAWAKNQIDWTGGMLNLSYFLGLVSKHDANDLAPALRPLTRKEQLEVGGSCRPLNVSSSSSGRPRSLITGWTSPGLSLRCGKDYNPSGSVSAVDVFYAIPLRGSKADWLNDQLKPWSGFSRGEPSYTDFQKIFRGRLEARGL